MKLNLQSHFKRDVMCFACVAAALFVSAIDHKGITSNSLVQGNFTLVKDGSPTPILVDSTDDTAVRIAVRNLSGDFARVTGDSAVVVNSPSGERVIIIGSLSSKWIKELSKEGKIDVSGLKGKRETYVMTTVNNPFPDVKEALVIAGSDRRGAVYGAYELSEQIGVSPWYDWADVPVVERENISIASGVYTNGEPAVEYRGIFLNDEAPCLTSWVKNTYGTNYGNHNFYERVGELILRLRGNYLWPAMWSWAFYADDPLNSKTADDMGLIMGTSHHEPMARNHQEYARNRKKYGKWDYASNKKNLDQFFKEGIERAKGTEDVITIGMRGDGDEAMSEDANVGLLKDIVKNQRRIIQKVTGKKASETPQVWALYKEVLDYYDKGMRAPDDVIYLVCDDNWGNVRRLPNEEERKHPGGWGMYYHVDYVGAPRNSKWINVTPIQNMWEQLSLTYDYGVDRLWILNVGDLKPMEYPITLFLDMAWNPKEYNEKNILEHTRDFCAQQFGADQADEAARILNLYSKYNGRITSEMLDASTYNLNNGEWKQVVDEYLRLEAEALRQYISLKPEYRDAYRELILFPVQAMGNVCDMYYSQAMNHELARRGNPEANAWAKRVEECFKRDSVLMHEYNKVMADGKWDGMMTQKHISYTQWNDDYPADVMPEVMIVDDTTPGGYVFEKGDGSVSMEAAHYYSADNGSYGAWTEIPYMGRTLSGIAVMPYVKNPEGASITYRFELPDTVKNVTIKVVTKSTLAFRNLDGHCYNVSLDGAAPVTVNFNNNLNESPENIYEVFYPTVARRVVEKSVRFPVTGGSDGYHNLTLSPLDPGVVFEKIVVDYGGYEESYLFGTETPVTKVK